MDLGFGWISRSRSSPSLYLHLQETLTERIRAEFEMRAGETFAIPKTKFNLSFHRAIQNRTDPAHEPQLGGQFPGGLIRQAGPAGTAPAFGKKVTRIAVDPAGTCSIHLHSS
jgi:hypothetical protein